jgi:AcrR family transcriptional regulator
MRAMRRETKKARLRERLFETALRLFRRQGYEATRVGQVTREAGVGKGTFFNHFPTKDLLLREWYRRATRGVLEEQRAAAPVGAREAIEKLLAALVATATRDRDLFAMKERHCFAGELLSDEERELDARLAAHLLERIEGGQATGEFPAAIDAPFLASMIVTILTGTAHEWVIAQHEFELSDRVAKRVGFLFDRLEPR